MPSRIVPRAGRFGARGKTRWLGTFDTRELAEAALRRDHSSRARPRRSRARRRVVPPSVAQVDLLTAEGPETLRRMVTIAAYTGLRLFEVAALTPEDLLDGPRIRVRVGKGGYRDEVSVIFPPALDAFRAAAAAVRPGELLFRTPARMPVSRQWVAKHFAAAAAAVGYKGTFHGLRHFHACWLIDRGGSDIDVAAQLRHHDNGQLVRSRYGWYRAQSAALARIQELG